jgi:hypothetical protein
MKFEFPRQILKKTKISNFVKIRPMEAELFQADGQTDGHNEANNRFSQVCERT